MCVIVCVCVCVCVCRHIYESVTPMFFVFTANELNTTTSCMCVCIFSFFFVPSRFLLPEGFFSPSLKDSSGKM